jgi:hypothetical protein
VAGGGVAPETMANATPSAEGDSAFRRATGCRSEAMNRIWKYLNEDKPEEKQPVARDYWVVRCYGMSFHVRPSQAIRIKRMLERRWKPTWMEFRDIAGSRIRVRTKHVIGMHEYTEKQREKDRRHNRYLEKEWEENEKPWDDC